MDQDQLRTLFEQVRTGAVDIEAAMGRMRHMPFEDLGFAKVDHHRALRHGLPEVIFAKGKTPEQVVAIARSLLARVASPWFAPAPAISLWRRKPRSPRKSWAMTWIPSTILESPASTA